MSCVYIYIRAAYQKWRLTWSGIESMCVKAVAQPNGLLFRNSHFQDTMGCCYTLITSLPQPLKRTGCAVTTCFMHKHHFLERIRNSFSCKKNTMCASRSRTRCIRCCAISEDYSVYPTMVWHRELAALVPRANQESTHTHTQKKKAALWDWQKQSLTCGAVNVCSGALVQDITGGGGHSEAEERWNMDYRTDYRRETRPCIPLIPPHTPFRFLHRKHRRQLASKV